MLLAVLLARRSIPEAVIEHATIADEILATDHVRLLGYCVKPEISNFSVISMVSSTLMLRHAVGQNGFQIPLRTRPKKYAALAYQSETSLAHVGYVLPDHVGELLHSALFKFLNENVPRGNDTAICILP